jgi:SAM-dependent methyltransferase
MQEHTIVQDDLGEFHRSLVDLVNKGSLPEALALLCHARKTARELDGNCVDLFERLRDISPLPLDTIDKINSNTRVLRVGGRVRWIDPLLLLESSKVYSIDSESRRFGVELKSDQITDFHDVGEMGPGSFDWVISSHVLEHLENPLKALVGCRSVLSDSGVIYSVVPKYTETFDRNREVTTLRHLVDDLERGASGVDWFHVEEFLRNYDCEADLVFKGAYKDFFFNYKSNPGRHTHYHVFDEALVFSMHGYAGFKCIEMKTQGNSIHFLGLKA